MLMQQSKYHIRVMRPTFERVVLTVEASSEEAAMQAVLEEAGRITSGRSKEPREGNPLSKSPYQRRKRKGQMPMSLDT
jgi:hypothetical protein